MSKKMSLGLVAILALVIIAVSSSTSQAGIRPIARHACYTYKCCPPAPVCTPCLVKCCPVPVCTPCHCHVKCCDLKCHCKFYRIKCHRHLHHCNPCTPCCE